jgi:hypothetical protein
MYAPSLKLKSNQPNIGVNVNNDSNAAPIKRTPHVNDVIRRRSKRIARTLALVLSTIDLLNNAGTVAFEVHKHKPHLDAQGNVVHPTQDDDLLHALLSGLEASLLAVALHGPAHVARVALTMPDTVMRRLLIQISRHAEWRAFTRAACANADKLTAASLAVPTALTEEEQAISDDE